MNQTSATVGQASSAPAPVPIFDLHVGALGSHLGDLSALAKRIEGVAVRLLGATPTADSAASKPEVGTSIRAKLENLHGDFNALKNRIALAVERLEQL